MIELAEHKIPEDLVRYIESWIVPLYDSFDKGHGREHVNYVISQSLELSRHYPVKQAIVYTAAAYHDTGLKEDRKTHHIVSARIVREDTNLRKWFTDSEIETIAEAVEDHRASLGHEPRSIYGKIVAEADRQIEPLTVIRRCIQFGLSHYPELGKEEHFRRVEEHLKEKYGDGGYLRLWIPESDNAIKIKELREIIYDSGRLEDCFDSIFSQETE
ncbi:MAG: HD domain-containing protein [Candidatus Cryptobacteroides sp.]